MNKFLSIVTAALIVVLIVREGCNSIKYKRLEKKCGQSTTKTDTQYIKEAFDIPVYIPKPGKIVYRDVPKYITKVINGEPQFVPVDTAAILSDYYASVPYFDTITVKYGKVYIKDTVTQNRIASRWVRTDFDIPVITKTVTKQPKGYMSAGVLVMYNQAEFINMAGVSLMYTTPGRLSIEGAALYGSQNRLNFQASVKFPLTLK